MRELRDVVTADVKGGYDGTDLLVPFPTWIALLDVLDAIEGFRHADLFVKSSSMEWHDAMDTLARSISALRGANH